MSTINLIIEYIVFIKLQFFFLKKMYYNEPMDVILFKITKPDGSQQPM